jgi:hypothetical protein
MTRSRRRCPGWLATAAGLLAACSGSSGGVGSDGGVGDGSPPGFDAQPPAGLFPLGVSADGGSLVTADGKPFLLHGEAAWSLIAQPDTAGAMQYLADRHARGVNLVIVNLIEHKFADHAPADAAGDAPFTTAGDFSTPNEAYFAHADAVIDAAASQGIAVLLAPAYLGYAGTDEGWSAEMSVMGNATGAPKCDTYGRSVGQRYAGKTNIVWLWGGDTTPATGSSVEACMQAIRDRIVEADAAAGGPRALTSAHWDHPADSLVEPTFAAALDLVGVYTYDPDLPLCRTSRGQTPRRPTYLMETTYENEHGAAPADVRRQQWSGLLGCGAGEIVGNKPIWEFGAGWPQQLASPVSLGEQRLAAIVEQVAWQTLALDDALVTAGRGTSGGADEVAATRTADHKQALIYVPPAGASQITVDLGQMSGPVTATWQDPTADHSVAAGNGLTGSQTFTTPGTGTNNGGDTDWVLVLSAP